MSGNIYLVGAMGSGKSTVAALLAARLGRPWADTDALVEQAAGAAISALFAQHGEAHFRDLEAAAVARVAARGGTVVATGGGVVLWPENREAMRRSGTVVWLRAPAAELYARLAAGGGVAARPLLQGDDPLGRLAETVAARAELYRAAAHIIIDTAGLTPTRVADAVIQRLEEWSHGGQGAD